MHQDRSKLLSILRSLQESSKDPYYAVPFIILSLGALLSLCYVFAVRYPNLRFLTNMCAISYIFFGLLTVWIAVSYNWKPTLFNERYRLIGAFLGNSKTRCTGIKSLFSHTAQSVTLMIFGLLPAILAAWLVQFLNVLGALLALVGEVVLVIHRFKGHRYLLVVLLIFCAPLILLFLEGEYYATAAGSGFLVGILCVEGWISRRRDRKVGEDVAGTLSDFVKRGWNLCGIAHRLIYDKDTIMTFQALVISVALLVYFAGARVMTVLPPDLSSHSGEISTSIDAFKGLLPYVVCIAYCLLSFSPLVAHLVKPFSIKREDNALKPLFNLAVAFVIVALLGPLFFFPVFFILACLFLAGEYFFGADLAVIVSFFAFPEWSARLYSALLVILLFAIPKWFMKRWISPECVS